jgi:hypothetical protein
MNGHLAKKKRNEFITNRFKGRLATSRFEHYTPRIPGFIYLSGKGVG